MHMTTISRPDAADVLARAGDHWGWLMGLGIITLLAGVAVLAWPGLAWPGLAPHCSSWRYSSAFS
jgi:uncharacterized membrane protein HdeD (DUF308 family)